MLMIAMAIVIIHLIVIGGIGILAFTKTFPKASHSEITFPVTEELQDYVIL